MAQRPLLFFPSKEIANRSKLGSGRGNFNTPSTSRQGQWFSPTSPATQRYRTSRLWFEAKGTTPHENNDWCKLDKRYGTEKFWLIVSLNGA